MSYKLTNGWAMPALITILKNQRIVYVINVLGDYSHAEFTVLGTGWYKMESRERKIGGSKISEKYVHSSDVHIGHMSD